METELTPLIQVTDLGNYLAGRWVHESLSMSVNKGEVVAIIGASGCGKTTLLNSILMLRQATCGSIQILGSDVINCPEEERNRVKSRLGVMFQSGALFSAMNVMENVMFPIRQFTAIRGDYLKKIAWMKLQLVGFPAESHDLYPAELSGGMIKRVAMARAIAMDPDIVFLDEPTAGLDPDSASEFDQLVLSLQQRLGLTVIMITHDLDTLWRVPDRVMFIADGRVVAALPMRELVKHDHPAVQAYFASDRARLRMPVS